MKAIFNADGSCAGIVTGNVPAAIEIPADLAGTPQAQLLLVNGVVTAVAAPPPAAPTEASYVAAVQVLLDTTAQQRRYDNILSACSYANSTNAQFKAEAEACVAWRDAVWAQCYTDLAAVQAGTMQQPTVEAFVASLPTLTWPAQA